MSETDATPATDQTPKTNTSSTAPAPARKKRRWPVLLLLLLALAAIAAGLLSGQLDRYLSLPLNTQSSPPAENTAPKPTVQHAPVISQKPEQPIQPARPTLENTPAVSTPVYPSMSSNEARALMQSIDMLNNSIHALQQQQQTLQQALDKQQQMHLTIRLRWISAADSKLPQIALAWEEIYLLPGLSDEQRTQAEHMQQLANHDLMLLKRWQNTLERWATHLAAPRQPDIIPHPEHPWLAWIAAQFHLRKAPAANTAKLDAISHELFAVAQSLRMEQWPDEQQWKKLRAKLVLLAEEQQLNVDLPESFRAIAEDKATLQATAQAWLEGGH